MKRHLATIRKGWQNENLAAFILSRFAFIAHPATVADDIGSDFFCTIFETKSENRRDYLVPKNSFAIQIKSNRRTFSISNKMEYLQELEIPFFVGVCSQGALDLTIYSGEYLVPFFVEKGTSAKLKIRLCERDACDDAPWDIVRESYVVKFPRVVTIGSAIGKMELKVQVRILSSVCDLISRNIAYRSNGEYIFSEYESSRLIMPFSANDVRRSLYNRVSRIFYELAWLLERRSDIFSPEERGTYQDLLESLTRTVSHDDGDNS
jgi:hypothetical protein